MRGIAGGVGGDRLVFGILGPIVVWDDDGAVITAPGHKLRALLALLVVDANVIVTTDRLIDTLWDGFPPPTARGTLHAYVSRLRSLLRGREDVAMLETLPAGYRLRVDPDGVDAFRFARLANEATARLHDDPDGAQRTIEAALALWRGPALVGGNDIDSVAFHAAALEELRLAAVETRMEAELARGRHAIAVGQLHELVQMHPLRERLHAQLMLALYRSGRQSEALRAYQTAHRVLAEEIGVVPGPELQALERRIATQDPELLPTPRPTADGPSLPLPLLVERTARSSALVGRAGELAMLDERLSRVQRAGAMLVSVSGAPGIGRTRLLAEFGRRAHAAGAVVLAGRARRDGSRPYQIVMDALGEAFAGRDGAARLDTLGEQRELIRPHLATSRPIDAPEPLDAPSAQYRLFGAVSLALQSLAADRPAVLLLDDCQFIDRSSVALLEYLIGDGSHSRVLVVGATRSRVAEQSPWDELLARLDVDGACAEVALAGLTVADVVAILPDHVAGRAEIARRLCTHTGGNPRFVHELLAAGTPLPDDDATWPAVVQDVFARRLVTASPSTQRLLGAGGIVGSRFELDTATTLAGLDRGVLDAACDEAVALGVVEADGPSALRFCADAARAASVDRIDPAERLDMRARVGTLLTVNASAAVVATYYRDAMDVVAGEAATWAQRAGDEAMQLLGFGEAIEHYSEALRVRATLPNDPLPTRARLLVALGQARHAAYDWQGALVAFRDAATVAEAAGALDLVADAACGLAGSAEFTLGDADALAVLERASTRRGLAPARRAVLFAGLARLLPTSDRRAWDLADEAVTLARCSGDRRSLATALGARCLVQWGPDDGEERARRADEVVTLAEHIGWVDLQMEAHNWRATALEESGDHDGAHRDVAILTAWAAQSRRPFFQGLAHLRRTSAALRDGDLATVDALLASPPAQAASSPNFASGFGAQLFFTEHWRGTTAALIPVLRDAVSAAPAIPAWRAPLALAVATSGDLDAARRELADALTTTFPCDWLWLAAHVVLAEAAVYANDASAARCLYDRLASHAEHNVVLAHGVVSFGSASRALGGLSAVLGRFDEAEHHLRVALRANAALGARAELAATQIELAHVLSRRDERADVGTLLADAARTVDECGLVALRARLDRTVCPELRA